MSRYVIELRPDCKVVQQICESNGQVCIGARSIQYLEELTADYINEHFSDLQDTAYQKGFDDAHRISEEEYQRGLNDAWEAARKVALNSNEGGLDIQELHEIFNCATIQQVFRKYTLSEVIAKLKAYEDDKIKRGDIVNVKGSCKDDLLGVVTKVWKDNCYIMWGDGSGGGWSKDSVVKTGKHIDVDKFFEEIAT